MSSVRIVIIDSEANDDWMKSLPGYDIEIDMHASLLPTTLKGGPGSGNFGHSGRPGHRGGSAGRARPSASQAGERTTQREAMRRLGIKYHSRMTQYIKYGLPVDEGRKVKWPEAKTWFDAYTKGGKGKKGVAAANDAIKSKVKPPKTPKPPKAPPPSKRTKDPGRTKAPDKPLKTGETLGSDTSSVGIKATGGKRSECKRTKKNIEETLGRLPQEHVDQLGEVRSMSRDEFVKRHKSTWHPDPSRYAGMHQVLSGVPGSKITLNSQVTGELKHSFQRNTLVHEVGHAVHSAIDPALMGSHKAFGRAQGKRFFAVEADRKRFNRRLGSMYTQAKKGTRWATRAYARTDVREYFAESYSAYVTKPLMLKKRDAEMYGMLRDNIFFGVEYDY